VAGWHARSLSVVKLRLKKIAYSYSWNSNTTTGFKEVIYEGIPEFNGHSIIAESPQADPEIERLNARYVSEMNLQLSSDNFLHRIQYNN